MSRKPVAVITGGAGYIGSCIVRKLSADGIRCAAFDLNAEAAEAAAAPLGGKGYAVNITDYDAVEKAFARVAEDLGGVDILVNCAGGSARREIRPFAVQKMEVIRQVLEMNLFGTFHCVRGAIPYMMAQEKGKIVNISSLVALGGIEGCSDYGASKGAIIAATKSWAIEFGPRNINVNCVCPGKVPRPNENIADLDAFARRYSFLNRACRGEDVAGLVAFLVSSAADCITGQNYVIDCGRGLGLKGDH